MDSTLELAGRLPDLQCLKTGFSRVSGAGIVHLQHSTSLTSLVLQVRHCQACNASSKVTCDYVRSWLGNDNG